MNGRQVIEVVRKTSMNVPPGGGGGGGGYPPTQGSFTPPAPGSDFNASPRLRPTAPGGRAYPNSNRYTLTDATPGVAAATASASSAANAAGVGARTQSVGGVRPGGRPPAARIPSGGIHPSESYAPPVPKLARTGPATFAEMGITAAKAEEKDCVIM